MEEGVGGDHFDIIVVGTGIAESIAAATLARAGYSVLHLDPNEYYGSQHASLTLSELYSWCEANGSRCTPIPDQLKAVERRYAISLAPSVLPSRGGMIDKLVEMDVGRYVEFRMLDGVLVGKPGVAADKDAMHFTPVPSSKEAVFKDKSISLIEKLRLMKVLMTAVGDVQSTQEVIGKEDSPLLETLRGSFGLPDKLATALSYGIAHSSSPNDLTLSSLIRMSRYLRSIGRYGSSAFLIAKYGGAGEIAQAFCRSCAVHGGTYVLGKEGKISAIRRIATEAASHSRSSTQPMNQQVKPSGEKKIAITIPAHPREITTSHFICSENLPALRDLDLNPAETLEDDVKYANCIALYEGIPSLVVGFSKTILVSNGEDEESSTDVLLFLIPPGGEGDDQGEVVRILAMGSGTGSCPDGQCIVYIQKRLSPDDLEVQFNPYLALISGDHPEDLQPSFKAYHISTYSRQPTSPLTAAISIVRKPDLTTGSPMWLEGLDFAAADADRLIKETGLEIPELEAVERDPEEDGF